MKKIVLKAFSHFFHSIHFRQFKCMCQYCQQQPPLSPRLKAYVLFISYRSGVGLQYKISRNSEKRLLGNLTQLWNLEQYLGVYSCMFVEQLCVHALVMGLDGRTEFHSWLAALLCKGPSAPHHFKQRRFVSHSVILVRSNNENCCMNGSNYYLFILFC